MKAPLTLPLPFRLPGVNARGPTCRIAGTRLTVPELDRREVQQVVAWLRDSARALHTQSVDERAQRVAAACAELRRRGARRWRETLAASTGLSLPGFDAAWEVTFAPLSLDALRAALHAESLHEDAPAGLAPTRPPLFLHVLAGNVLAPTMQVLTRGWLLGAAQWLRPAAREPLFAACVLSELEDVDADLAASTAVLWWPHGGRTEAAVIEACDTVSVQGDDDSVAAVQRRVEEIRPQAKFVAYGSRWSAALFSKQAQTLDNARALAFDVALFDQQGCLSPTLAFVERAAHTKDWCTALASAFSALETRMPRGPLSAVGRAGLRYWHERMRLKHVLGTVEGLWEDAIRWGVVLCGDRGAADADIHGPLDRHLVVFAFDELESLCAALSTKLGSLQGLAIALDGWEPEARRQALQRFAPSLAAPVGTLQMPPPSWPQDHKPPLRSLLATTLRNSPQERRD